MNYQQLREECRALGFENTFPSDAVFLSCANRALRLIACERGRTKTVTLPLKARRKTLISPLFSHTGGASEVFSLSGAAFSFRVSGSGSVTVTEGGISRTIAFSSPAGAVRGFLSGGGDASLAFSGDLAYTVSDLALFPDREETAEEDIPLVGGERSFAMRDLAPDFLCFAAEAVDERGKPLPDISLTSGEIRAPENFSGVIRVSYRAAPCRVSGNAGGEELDVPPECEALLPLLTSSYLWLDDDPEKATYYLSLYREALASVKRTASVAVTPRYHDVVGW